MALDPSTHAVSRLDSCQGRMDERNHLRRLLPVCRPSALLSPRGPITQFLERKAAAEYARLDSQLCAEPRMREHHDTIVIGGGQAGLAMSAVLQKRGRE